MSVPETINQNFLPRLKDYILAQILGQQTYGDGHDFTDEERNCVSFVNNRMYRHKVFRVNYTTYDMRRAQDSMNPRTHADIMVLSHENKEKHPYWYARIIGIFHTNVRHVGPTSKCSNPQKMEFLWVRWFSRDMRYQAGWNSRRLHRVKFTDHDSFGFLNPKEVIRGVHLLPAFAYGRTSAFLAPSIARQPSEEHEDWNYYYVNMYVNSLCLVVFTDQSRQVC